jgi:hypothetical protein
MKAKRGGVGLFCENKNHYNSDRASCICEQLSKGYGAGSEPAHAMPTCKAAARPGTMPQGSETHARFDNPKRDRARGEIEQPSPSFVHVYVAHRLPRSLAPSVSAPSPCTYVFISRTVLTLTVTNVATLLATTAPRACAPPPL